MKKNKLKILLFLDHCLTVFASLNKNGGQAVELEKEDDGVLAREEDGDKGAHVKAEDGREAQGKEGPVLEDERDENAADLRVQHVEAEEPGNAVLLALLTLAIEEMSHATLSL